MLIPVAFEVVRKPLCFCDAATRQLKRANLATKNEPMRDMIAARENFAFIVKKKKHFIAALKENRLVALSEAGKKQECY